MSVELTLNPGGAVFANGTDAVDATGAVKRFIVSGTWVADDEIDFTVNVAQTTYELGKGPAYDLQPVDVMAHDDKVYVSASAKLMFSGLLEPTGFENRYVGFGFVTMSKKRGQAAQVLGAAVYSGKVVPLARNVVQLWVPNADPSLWQLLQTLDNVGTVSGKSIVGVGDTDVFFASDSGIRSIRAREFTDLVNVSDVGSLINRELRPIIRALSDADKAKIISFYDVQDGRVWFFLPGYVYVFSYYPDSKISAWTRFEPQVWTGSALVAFAPTDMAIKDGVPYLLQANTGATKILARYPGATITRNATTVATIPFFAEKKVATLKLFKSIDIIGKGTWKVEVGDNPKDESSFQTIADAVTMPTLGSRRVPLHMRGTHIITRLTHTADEEAIIASAVYHYSEEKAS